jgi:hypothetical protein
MHKTLASFLEAAFGLLRHTIALVFVAIGKSNNLDVH